MAKKEKEYEEIGEAELSAIIRGHQNGGTKVIVIQMDMDAYESGIYGNADPSSLADAIYQKKGRKYLVLRERIPREPVEHKKRERI